MQYTSVELYNETSVKNNIPLHKVKFVGDVVFNAINKNINHPEAIILKIKNIGKFYMRKNKLDGEIGYLEGLSERNEKQEKRLMILKERLVDYNEYLVEKQKIKKIRHEYQSIVEPPIQEEDF